MENKLPIENAIGGLAPLSLLIVLTIGFIVGKPEESFFNIGLPISVFFLSSAILVALIKSRTKKEHKR